ncbi:hypothetical protein [Streptomyces albidus (ex Kaewkla and Franco 2022)]|uniref:hypothetical protein n=1 Tax=Streptomyces albidus (ex Kaewkla and Franco 2022) TaxID=722709 RepID=UPI0015EEC655|nr:hypothetical protein [Streptomyces albidus (ex Kaewkla and Franco 2022)]
MQHVARKFITVAVLGAAIAALGTGVASAEPVRVVHQGPGSAGQQSPQGGQQAPQSGQQTPQTGQQTPQLGSQMPAGWLDKLPQQAAQQRQQPTLLSGLPVGGSGLGI